MQTTNIKKRPARGIALLALGMVALPLWVAGDAHAQKPGRAGQLVAFVVPGDGQSVEPDALRAWLESRLPPYMVPRGFETLEALPRTVAGKVDRPALARSSEEGPGGRGLDTGAR